MRRFVRYVTELIGVPFAMTGQAYVLISVLFWKDQPALWSFAFHWGGSSAMGCFLGYIIWSDEARQTEADGGKVDDRPGWALLICAGLGVVIALVSGFVPTSAPYPEALKVVLLLCLFGQQVFLWVAAHTGAREFRQCPSVDTYERKTGVEQQPV